MRWPTKKNIYDKAYTNEIYVMNLLIHLKNLPTGAGITFPAPILTGPRNSCETGDK